MEMKFLRLTSHLRRPVLVTFGSIRNRLSCCNSHLPSYLPVYRCKFSSISNTAKPSSEPSLTPASDLVQEFTQILNGDLQSVANHPLSADCQKWLPDLDDHQFLTILSNFDTFFQQKGGDFKGPPQDHPLNKLMLGLDSECCKRFADGDYSKALSLLETHRFFLAVHHSTMIQRVLRHNCRTPFSAPKPLLHRYLAFMNHHRLWSKPFKFYWVEYALQFRLDELDLADVCAFLQAYIVTANRYISDDQLLVRIFAKFTDQLDNIHKSHLLTFLLFANRLMYIYQFATITPHVTKMLDFLNANFEAYPLTCHINAAALSTKLLMYRPQYLQRICDALVKIPEISVDAFLNVGTDVIATTKSVKVASMSLPSSSLGDIGTTFDGAKMNWPVSQPTTSERVTGVSAATDSISGNKLIPSVGEVGHSISCSNSMATLFPYNEGTLPAMHIMTFTKAVAFFNCTHLAAQLMPFLESSPVSRHFLHENLKLYVSSITYLAQVGLFSHLISTFLSEEFLLKVYRRITKYTVPRYISFLDATVRIECPDYRGHYLEPEFRRKMNQFMVACCPYKVFFVDRQTFQANYKLYANEAVAREYVVYKYTTTEAAALLSELLGGDHYIHVCRALPHLCGENLIWCTDAAGNPQKLSPEVKQARIINFEAIKPEQNWFILVCSSCNMHDKAGAGPMVVCKEVAKVRQMKLLGFQVVEVVHEEWELMSRDQRIGILKEKLGLPVTK